MNTEKSSYTRSVKKYFWEILFTTSIMVTFVGVLSYYSPPEISAERMEAATESPMAPTEPPLDEVFPYQIPSRSSLYSVLREHDIASPIIQQIVKSAKPVIDLSRLAPGIRFQILRSGDTLTDLVGLQLQISPVEKVEIKKVNDGWVAEKITAAIETQIVTFQGVVKSTLWESAEEAQMDPNLIFDLSEIFGWQIDFAREVRLRDRWRLTVEQKLVRGRPMGWGSILAAEYENAGELHQAVLFKGSNEASGYYSMDGASLRRMFLKSPIKFGRITSRFQMRRFHPILKTHRPHLGVDYAAPMGTPIRAVGDGQITSAGFNAGAGNAIHIRHNSTYATAYKHLSRYGKGIRAGARVSQGQIIGYVGSTGLSTAAHLHFEFFQNGRFVDPLGKKFPSADPVPTHLITEFQNEARTQLAALPQWNQSPSPRKDIVAEDTTSPVSVSQ